MICYDITLSLAATWVCFFLNIQNRSAAGNVILLNKKRAYLRNVVVGWPRQLQRRRLGRTVAVVPPCGGRTVEEVTYCVACCHLVGSLGPSWNHPWQAAATVTRNKNDYHCVFRAHFHRAIAIATSLHRIPMCIASDCFHWAKVIATLLSLSLEWVLCHFYAPFPQSNSDRDSDATWNE